MAMIPSSGPNSNAGKRFCCKPHPICAATIRHCYGDATARFQHVKPSPEARFHVVHMLLGHVPGVNLIGAIRFETREGGNVLVTIGSHLAIAVDIAVTFLVENPAAEVKFHFAKIRSEEHTSELQSPVHLVCRLLL